MEVRVALRAADDVRLLEMVRAFEGVPPGWRLALGDDATGDVVVACDGSGDVAFDPADPGRAVAEVERLATERAVPRVAVLGARGGCGATTVALHLAAVWPGGGACVLEVGDRGLAERLDLPEGHLTWSRPDGDRAGAVPVPPGLEVLPSGGAERGWEAALASAARRAAAVVIDGPPAVLERAGCAVLVVPPTRPGCRSAAALLEAAPQMRWAIVVNRTGPGGEIRPSDLERALGHRVALELPCTPAVRDAEDEGRLAPLSWTRFGRRIRALARALHDL